MEDIVALSVADRRFQLSLMVAFGCAAALLAALGVYGVVSHSVDPPRAARWGSGSRSARARPTSIGS